MVKFYLSSWKSEICTLVDSFCKNHVSAKRLIEDLQKTYMSWHWKVMQSLTKTAFWFPIQHDDFGEFSPNHSKVRKFHFDGLFLPIVYEVWAKKMQKSCLWWHWTWCKMGINLDLVVSKMRWGIGSTFIRALKSLKN